MRILLSIIAILVAVVGCASPPEAPLAAMPTTPDDEVTTGFDLATARIVDLTHDLGPDSLFWPTSPSQFELEVLHAGPTDGGYYYAANTFCTPEHGGTHLDAPIHFAEGRRTVDAIPVDQLVAPAVVIDVREAAAADPDYRLTVDDLAAWEAAHGEVPEGAAVLLHTGWSERWPSYEPYFGSAAEGDASDLHFPSFGEEATRVLVGERGIGVLGVDTASIDSGASKEFLVHRVAAEAEVPGLENMTNLAELPPTGAWIVALPVKISGGSGGPVRVIGLVPR